MTPEQKRNQNLMSIIKKMHERLEETDVEKARAGQEHLAHLTIPPKGIEVESIDLDGLYAEWIRPVKPHDRTRVILYCHGGGYMTGSCLYARTITYKLAETTGMDILCFDYRLSPENVYPAAMEDAMKAWDYLMHRGYGAGNVVVCGDSAGGNMALVHALKLQKENRFMPAAVVLYSPWTDMTLSGKSYETKKNLDPILTKEYIKLAVERYAPEEDPASPFLSPLLSKYRHDFPPVYIQVGTNEILLSDSKELYKKLKDANIHVKLDIFKGMWHVFQMTPFKTASEAMEKTADFIFDIFR